MSQLRRLRRAYKPAVLVACRRECYFSRYEYEGLNCEGGTTYLMYSDPAAVFVFCCGHARLAYGGTELSGPAEFEEMKLAIDVMES